MVSVVLENAFFIVLNKPEGVSTHNENPSLLDWLKERNLPQNFVNRLDQQTSGLVVIAQKPEYQEPLQTSLHAGQKIYRALLRGGWKQEPLKWEWSLSDKAEGRKNPQGLAKERKSCLTLIEVLRTNTHLTEVFCEIKSGRQHQIRKHAALAKHPIVGDSRYNDDKYNQKISAMYQTDRMFLHAEKINFSFRGENYTCTAPGFNCDVFFTEIT